MLDTPTRASLPSLEIAGADTNIDTSTVTPARGIALSLLPFHSFHKETPKPHANQVLPTCLLSL